MLKYDQKKQQQQQCTTFEEKEKMKLWNSNFEPFIIYVYACVTYIIIITSLVCLFWPFLYVCSCRIMYFLQWLNSFNQPFIKKKKKIHTAHTKLFVIWLCVYRWMMILNAIYFHFKNQNYLKNIYHWDGLRNSNVKCMCVRVSGFLQLNNKWFQFKVRIHCVVY